MYDINRIVNDTDYFAKNMIKRGFEITTNNSNIKNNQLNLERIIELNIKIKQLKTQIQSIQTKKNLIIKEVGKLKSDKGSNKEIENLSKQSVIYDDEIILLEKDLEISENEINTIILYIPNIIDDSVPYGKNDENNFLVRESKTEKRVFDFKPKKHYEIGSQKIDFESSASISGSRFVILHNEMALLERALTNFMLDVHTSKFGFSEISVPVLVKEKAMFLAGQLPKFKEESFVVEGGYRLIPTSEVYLVNLIANQCLNLSDLPLRFTASTKCFRSEAGSSGKDVKGMIRLHEFPKVELVSVTTEEDSKNEHEFILNAAEEILKLLQIPYRVMLLCSGDTGFHASKTYDIEVWLPGENKYREISSCSNCTDFQSRRLNAKYIGEDKKKKFTHTLNGSGLAVGRTMVAIIENYQNENGSINVPEVLIPYFKGKKLIES